MKPSAKPLAHAAAAVGLAALCVAAAGAHTLYLVVPDHDLPAHSDVTVALYNGTFLTSENTIDRDRMVDVTVVDERGMVTHPPEDRWREEGDVTLLDLETGDPGTYLVGVSTAPRMIELTQDQFDEYLEHDGVTDVLQARREARETGEGSPHPLEGPVRERYAKHVKTLLDVGGEASETYDHRFGYPVELVPLENPALLETGQTLPVLVLAGNEALIGQLVHAGHAAPDPADPADTAEGDDGHDAVTVRTDANGIAHVELGHPGRWYVRTIHMFTVIREASGEDPGVDYVSEWATLTFDVD